MKSIFASLYGIFTVTAIITHIWTVIIAFSSGFLSGIITLFLPFISEIYWMFKMFGVNNTYAYIALMHLVLAVIFAIIKSDN